MFGRTGRGWSVRSREGMRWIKAKPEKKSYGFTGIYCEFNMQVDFLINKVI